MSKQSITKRRIQLNKISHLSLLLFVSQPMTMITILRRKRMQGSTIVMKIYTTKMIIRIGEKLLDTIFWVKTSMAG